MASAPVKELLNNVKLTDASGAEFDLDTLKGKTIGLYFSAHWCGPCRGFTPQLADFYKKNAEKLKFEIVFVSSDKDEASWKEYLSEMPWKALQFSERDLKASLSKQFKVRGIPTFVIVDENGETITTDGRSGVSGDPEGKNFPWKPKTFFEILGDQVDGKDGKVNVADIKKDNKAIGLYFSAHWCGPCRGFTPSLVKAYNTMKAANKGFEIIFCSSDRDEKSYEDYYGEMPWLTIPLGDDRKDALSKKYSVRGIPSLIIVNAQNGETITANGRAAVQTDPEGADFPWLPKPLNELSGSNGELLNEETCLIAFVGDDEKSVEELNKVATAYAAKWEAKSDKPLYFLYVKDGNPLKDRITGFLKVADEKVTFLLLF
mmetsp:Transcript_14833/g.16467  ORF Transcript_14833/g.16467 Transcript_14833/m.16467 type:complete len:374 (+) Transcript_14833:25-1146(+)